LVYSYWFIQIEPVRKTKATVSSRTGVVKRRKPPQPPCRQRNLLPFFTVKQFSSRVLVHRDDETACTYPISSFLYRFGRRLEHRPDSSLGRRARARGQASSIKTWRPNWRMAPTFSAPAPDEVAGGRIGLGFSFCSRLQPAAF